MRSAVLESSGMTFADHLYRLKVTLVSRMVSLAARVASALSRPFGRLCIVLVWGDRFGPLWSEPAKFLRLRETPAGKDLLLIGIVGPICNEAALPILRRGMPIVKSDLLHRACLLTVQRGLARDLIQNQDHEPYLKIYNQVRRSPLDLTAEEERRGAHLLARLGVPPGAWFVCFHARDPAYLNNSRSPVAWRYHDYRDCSIENFVPAMRRISELGGYAIRMGSAVERALPQDDPRIIDFASTNYDPFLDIYLLARCRFLVGCTSGVHACAEFFDRPIGMTNTIPMYYVPAHTYSRFIPKLLRDNTGRVLSFAEMGELGIMNDRNGRTALGGFYEENGLEVVENTADDILALTDEMLQVETCDRRTPAQLEFNRYMGWPKADEECASIADSFLMRHPELLQASSRATAAHDG